MRFIRTIAALGWLAVSAACDPGGSDDHTDGHPATITGTAGAGADGGLTVCGTDPLVQNYTVSGSALEVTMLALSPAPPRIYQNEWLVAISDASGEPVTDPSAVVVQPWMVEHAHGARTPPVLVATDTPGEFQVTMMNLHMKGLWDVRFMRPEDMDNEANWTVVYTCVSDGE